MIDRDGTNPAASVARDGAYATVTISRPERRNALTADDAADVAQAIHDADDGQITALILTGTDGSFCAGGDLKSFAATCRSAPT